MSCAGVTGADLQVGRAADPAETAAAVAASRAQGQSATTMVLRLIEALGSVLIPTALIAVVCQIWPDPRDIFETRQFTIKIAGFELSAQEAADHLRAQIEALQSKVEAFGTAQGLADTVLAPTEAWPETAVTEAVPQLASGRILWVEDQPFGNAASIASFHDEGIAAKSLETIAEALSRLDGAAPEFASVISDPGRIGDGFYHAGAGAKLLRSIRQAGVGLPVAIYSTARGVRMGAGAKEAGTERVAASATDVRSLVTRNMAEHHAY